MEEVLFFFLFKDNFKILHLARTKEYSGPNLLIKNTKRLKYLKKTKITFYFQLLKPNNKKQIVCSYIHEHYSGYKLHYKF